MTTKRCTHALSYIPLIHDTNSMTYQFDLEMNKQNILILGLNFYLL